MIYRFFCLLLYYMISYIKNLFYYWRYYTLGREQYKECMKKTFKINLYSLRQGNFLTAVLTGFFSLFPLLINADIKNASLYFLASFLALIFAFVVEQEIQRTDKHGGYINKKFIYIFTVAYYVNIIMFGLFLGIWLNPGNSAVTIMVLLVCAMSLFVFSPLFNLCLTACAIAVFITAVIFVKDPQMHVNDICNALFAGVINLIICWRIPMLRLLSILNENKLEDERDKYLDESTIDELTKLKNRRDFIHTFQRYLVNFRSSDDWLCIAIADIDFFKSYNDHYGHLKGDDCLRAIGGAFNRLKDTMGVYCARVGGEEFAMLWFENDLCHIGAVVNRINKLLKTLKIPHEKSSVSEYVTMSIGVYVEKCGTSKDYQKLYSMADKSLYTAKENGRNCAIISGAQISIT